MLDNKMKIKKGDTVMVITGKDSKKTGKVLRIFTKKDKIVIEGLNIIKKHNRSRGNQPGGIEEKEAPIHISNVMMFCAKCNKPVRIKKQVLENSEKIRTCSKCGEAFDK
ncbi:MAG: 50S ribosomal protein L24 [SAR324 cluster bacterium]|uniref:Large ribosomal subunit protein uL24 n=1 Tax=SAR324 cluster bacterium TaxID=2024889 RepID=A0A7X9FP71_9DELT|nr:50S ribosomal protein L24 [SAR324 cluster bacterium]